MARAARVGDPVSHPTPPVLTGGPGSSDVSIGHRPAWRALPAGLGAAIAAASEAVDGLMASLVLTPVDAELTLADIKDKLGGAADEAAGQGILTTRVAAETALVGLDIANDALVTTWNTASAAPGGQPAANEAYAQGLQAAVAVAAGAIFATLAPLFDSHGCGVPVPHGIGFVTVGSASVSVNHLPLARQGDQVMEAAGGANPISNGYAKVTVGG